jgi:hypothetical protein
MMRADDRSEFVSFVTAEDGGIDLIVSFAIEGRGGGILSLMLLRTPRYEFLVPPEERGVWVTHEQWVDSERELLRRLQMNHAAATIETPNRRYRLDVSNVEREELRDAQRVLRRMNFDRSFTLELA